MIDYAEMLRGLSIEELEAQLRGAKDHLEERKAEADRRAIEEGHEQTHREFLIQEILRVNREASLYS